MEWLLRIQDGSPFREEREPGMMWRYPDGDRDGRECWWIQLPRQNGIGQRGHPGDISFRTTQRDSSTSTMWEVTGVPPNITVHPSIDVIRYLVDADGAKVLDANGAPIRDGSYFHGWITNGVLHEP